MAPLVDAPGVFVRARGPLGEVAVGAGAFGEVGHGDPGKSVAGGLVIKGNIDPTHVVGRSSRAVSTRVLSETFL